MMDRFVDRGEDLDGALALVVYILPCEIACSVHGVLMTTGNGYTVR